MLSGTLGTRLADNPDRIAINGELMRNLWWITNFASICGISA